jgi:membrane protease YdiL (CAAX protease family)
MDHVIGEARPFGRVGPDRRAQTIELGVFLLLLLPSLLLALILGAGPGERSFVVAAAATIARDVAVVALILFFLWKNGEPLERIGWRARGAGREAALGLALFTPMFIGALLVVRVLVGLGLSGPESAAGASLAASGRGQAGLGSLLVLVIALAEETVFRGYLLLRLEAATGSFPRAAAISSTIFALGHGYEGIAGVLTVGLLGLSFALLYRWRGSLVAPVTLHFLNNLVAIVVVPALAGAR